MNEEMEIDMELIIALVEARPVLWDKTLDIYKDRNATRKAWQEVCVELKPNFNELEDKEKNEFGKDIIKRWTNVRDAFAKSCKKGKKTKKSGAGASRHKKYIFNNELQFLLKIYTIRNVDNFDKTENTVQEVEVNSETSQEKVDEDSNVSAGRTEFNSRSRKRRKPDDVEIRILKALEDNEKPVNRHLSFFQSIIPAVEKLDESEVLQFQMGVLQLISNINEQKRRTSLLPSFSAQPPLVQPHYYTYPHQSQYPQAPAQYYQNVDHMPALNRSLGSPCSSSSTTAAEYYENVGQMSAKTAISHPLTTPSPVQSTSSCIDFAADLGPL